MFEAYQQMRSLFKIGSRFTFVTYMYITEALFVIKNRFLYCNQKTWKDSFVLRSQTKGIIHEITKYVRLYHTVIKQKQNHITDSLIVRHPLM